MIATMSQIPYTLPSAATERADLITLIAQMIAESRSLSAQAAEPKPAPVLSLRPDTQTAALADAMHVIKEANELLTQQQARIRQLEDMLMQDEMTGLLNRRGLEALFMREQSRVRRRQSRGCTLVAFDLDKFKEINDTYGHQAGDAALRCVGDFFLRIVRTTDAIARIGGDEFALLLADIYPDVANRRAAAIGDALNNLSFEWRGTNIRIQSSIGVARSMPDETFENLYRQADVALYAAKIRRRS